MIIYFYFKVKIDSKYIEGKIIKKYLVLGLWNQLF